MADGAHADAVRAVAPQVFDVDVAGVRLGREAIVTDVDLTVRDRDTLDVQGVPAVGVLRSV